MTVTVRFFASLREQTGIKNKTIELPKPATVGEVWRCVTSGSDIPDNLLMTVNMEYEKADTVVHDGDEVAFFPPVTGGGR